MKKNITLLFLAFSVVSFSQIRGKITSNNKKPLSFVSVYLQNSITGTTSNDNGDYELSLSTKGKHTIVFQILGYKTVKKTVDIQSFPFELNVQLSEEEVALDEVLVSSTENPANKIIRNTIANKKKNTDKFAQYKADFYSRGLFKVKNLPKKFLGQEIGDMGGGLDSTRSGIVYLSETISKISFQKKPKNFKEHIIASKVSGSDNGISFNQAEEVNFNFYENSFNLAEAQMVSPIANGAFGYYNYKLVGTFYDKNGNLINKIELLPKRKNDRVFSGFIYIVEDDWAIYGADVIVTGNQVSMPMIDSLNIKQNYNFSSKNKAWVPVTQTIDFKAGMFGFNFNGRFSAAYSNYNFTPNFTTNSFGSEILSFAENATEKDSVYWNKIRPVALTKEEVSDYKLKDSIKAIRKSKKYLDSVDTKRNKFRLLDILTGYSYRNSYDKWSLNISSPIEDISFNTVQGWNTSIGGSYYKTLNKKGKSMGFGANVNYGLSDKEIRPTGYFFYKWNNTTRPILNISGGNTVAQFDAKRPISKFWNTISSVLFERNYMKIYEKNFAKVSYSQEVTNGIRLNGSLEYADRKPLFNTTDYVMFPKSDVAYTSNNPQDPSNFTSSFTPHTMWSFNIGANIVFGQKYLSYPDSKFNIGNNKYPSLYIGYRKNFGSENSEWNSDLVYSQLYQNISMGNWGQFQYRAKGGMFLEQKDIPFMDYAHFNGNRLLIAPNSNYLTGFLALPYYQLSSNDKFGELHGEYNFKGALLSKIPLINKLNFHLVTGAKGLFTGGNKPYSEYSVGLDNVGFGKWRFLRVDFVRSNFNGQSENRVVFGIKL
ncbi:Carboxypeptidase-like regulatory domain-containing protein [Tenacibaculum sp. 190130A14a]|uniref:Carboxypeptidase-like regulatory domain-containing protein n=1 Tax=Tenacibaculum polynesiense TaxID=3137857 RepID=A0ABP1F072_9FLAO